MFEYFPENYSWNLGLLMALQLGGEISEIDLACRPLIDIGSSPGARDNPAAQAAWVRQWSTLAQRVLALAAADEARAFTLAAGRKYLRSATYWMTAERMASHGPERAELYERFLRSFQKGIELRKEPVEFVAVPYENTTLRALFYRAPGISRQPAMIHLDGFDVTKEWIYLSGLAQELALRGVSTLMLDHPGVGEALRLQGLTASPESERWATAAMDYLETRSDVDIERVGIAGMSLGGYYAPRAAAFEKRIACCVAWGARFDNANSHGRILRNPQAARSVAGWVEHALRVYGAKSQIEAEVLIRRMTLANVADKITCPLLVVHGESDRQVPRDEAIRTVNAATSSPRCELKVFTQESGGVEHVQGDLLSVAIDFISDWVGEVLNSSSHSILQPPADASTTKR